MYTFRKLEIKDKKELEFLISTIETTLENDLFWLPISDKSRDNFFNNEWTYFIGAFKSSKLIAVAGLFLNKNEYKESQKLLGLDNFKLAEIGRAMVHPDYRGEGLMSKISKELILHAKEFKIDYVVATAHPSNYASVKSLESVGMVKKISCIKKEKYPRDIFLLKCCN